MDEITLKLNSQQDYKNNIETNKPNSNKKLKELKSLLTNKHYKQL